MDFLIIGSVAFGASLLTFFSGFGLGTLLLPAFALFFSTPVALAATGALFLASHLYDTTLFKPPEEGIVHLQDSCWLRTISYNLMRETPIIPELADALFEAHPRFGTVIYLTASIEVRKVRVQEREVKHPGSNTSGDFMSFTDPEFVMRHDRKLLETTRRFYPAIDVIDTSAMNADDTIEAGWRILQSKFLKGAT